MKGVIIGCRCDVVCFIDSFCFFVRLFLCGICRLLLLPVECVSLTLSQYSVFSVAL